MVKPTTTAIKIITSLYLLRLLAFLFPGVASADLTFPTQFLWQSLKSLSDTTLHISPG